MTIIQSEGGDSSENEVARIVGLWWQKFIVLPGCSARSDRREV